MNKMNTEVVPVGIVRRVLVEGAAAEAIVEQSRLAELPDATVIFAQRQAPGDAGLMQEVVAIELLEKLKSGGVPLAERMSSVQLAVAVIGNSRRKLDLFAGTVDMMRAALAQSEAARLVLIAENEALLAAATPGEGEFGADEAPAAWIAPGASARHKQHGGLYTISGSSLCKVDGEWRPAVVYTNSDGEMFVRAAGMVNRNFEPV